MTKSPPMVGGSRAVLVLLQVACVYVCLALSVSSHSPAAKCPPLSVLEQNHSSLVDFAVRGANITLFQVFCSQPNTASLNGHWNYDTGLLGPHASSVGSYTDQGRICANFSLQLFDVTFAASDGYYTVAVSSGCGSRANRTFILSVSGCPCDEPPQPHLHQHAAWLVAESDTPKNFTLLSAHFHGCASALWYNAVVQVNNTAVCSDDTVFRGNYECTRKNMYDCLFIVEVTAVQYDHSDSGEYCIHSQPQDGGNGSNTTCFQTQVLPWPTIAGPLKNISTTLSGGTLRWRLHNFFPAGLVITAYKDYTQAVETRTDTIPDTTDAFVYVDVPRQTSGRYQLFIRFAASVDTEGSGFHNVWSDPGYAQDSGVNVVAVSVPIALIASFAVVCSASFGMYRWRRKRQARTYLQESRIDCGDTRYLLDPVGVKIKGSARRTTNYRSGANCPVISSPTVNSGSPHTDTDSAFTQNSPAPSQASENAQQLMSHFKDIMASVKPAALLPHLQSKGLVTPEESEYISSTPTNHQCTQLIIQALLSKGEDVIERFAAALSEEKQHPPHQRLAKRLTQALAGSPLVPPTASPAVRDVIYPHMPAIAKQVDPTALLPHLIGHELVTNDDVDHIQNPTRTDLQRIQYIILGLFRCGEGAVEAFVQCLIEERTHPPHRELAELLIRELSQQEQHRELAGSLRGGLEEARRRGLRDGPGSGEGDGHECQGHA